MRPRRNTQAIGGLVLAMGAILITALGGSAAASPCPNEAFRNGPSAGLPNCRAYELASPVDKNGGEVEGFAGQFRAAEKGAGITFFTQGGTQIPSPVGGTQTYGTYLARRIGDNWATQRLLAPPALGESPYSDWLGSTPDLRYSLVQAGRFGKPEPTFGLGLFLVDTESEGQIETIVPTDQNPSETISYAFDGASENDSRIFFETEAALTPGAHELDNLYMWNRTTQKLSLVGIMPAAEGGEESEFGTFGGPYEWFLSPNEFAGGALGGLAVEATHAISSSGDQVYFTAALNPSFEFDQLYLRRGLTGQTPSTVRVSAPEAGVTDPNGTLPAAFQEATPSGSKAFFLSSQKLTADATTGPADEGKDLYRWDASDEKLVDVAPDLSDTAGAQVEGLIGISSDGSSGYFAAKGALTLGASAGTPNIYRFDEAGGGFTITFVATLNEPKPADRPHSVDIRNWSPRTYAQGGAVVSAEKPWKTSRTSSNGDVLLFTSAASLTGYDNTNPAPEVNCNSSTEPCAEIYRYSAATDQLTCVSCQPQGAAPLGSAQLESNLVNSFLGPNFAPNVQLTRNLSQDGNRVFFETPDPLVAADTNGNIKCPYYQENQSGTPIESEPECQDVYEWEAPGSTSCPVAETNEGCVHLLSTGKSTSASYLLDASQDGSNVFVATRQQLVPIDRDFATDVYDVAVEGGIAAQRVEPEPRCEGESCRGSQSTLAPVGNPASSRFEGSGNVKPQKHHKKKHHKKKHHKKKHHKKKHHKKNSSHKRQHAKSSARKANAGGAK